MGIFPDWDVFLIPLANKYNNQALYHRGAVHSLLFLGIANLIGAFIMNSIFPGNFLLYFGIGYFCSSMHLFCDILTTFPIRPFWPLSKKGFKLDITEAVNMIGVFFSMGAAIILYHTWYISPSPIYLTFVLIFSIIIGGFLLIQFLTKVFLSYKLNHLGTFQSMPTMTPFQWKIVQKQVSNHEMTVKFARYNIYSRTPPKFQEFEIGLTPSELPIETDSQAISYSFNLPEVKRHLWRIQNPLYCIEKSNGAWKIHWFSAEMFFFGRTFAILVELEPSGNYTTKAGVFRIKECRFLNS